MCEDVGGRDRERRGQLPEHISSHQAINGGANANSAQGYPCIPDVGASGARPPDVVVSPSTHSPSRIHRGFMLDATTPAELPGSKGTAVITTPPHPQGVKTGSTFSDARPRARSIEELDKHRENYVPSSNASEGGVGGVKESSSYCLGGLSSFIISQDAGHDDQKRVLGDRKASATSQASTISVSGEVSGWEKLDPVSPHLGGERVGGRGREGGRRGRGWEDGREGDSQLTLGMLYRANKTRYFCHVFQLPGSFQDPESIEQDGSKYVSPSLV